MRAYLVLFSFISLLITKMAFCDVSGPIDCSDKISLPSDSVDQFVEDSTQITAKLNEKPAIQCAEVPYGESLQTLFEKDRKPKLEIDALAIPAAPIILPFTLLINIFDKSVAGPMVQIGKQLEFLDVKEKGIRETIMRTVLIEADVFTEKEMKNIQGGIYEHVQKLYESTNANDQKKLEAFNAYFTLEDLNLLANVGTKYRRVGWSPLGKKGKITREVTHIAAVAVARNNLSRFMFTDENNKGMNFEDPRLTAEQKELISDKADELTNDYTQCIAKTKTPFKLFKKQKVDMCLWLFKRSAPVRIGRVALDKIVKDSLGAQFDGENGAKFCEAREKAIKRFDTCAANDYISFYNKEIEKIVSSADIEKGLEQFDAVPAIMTCAYQAVTDAVVPTIKHKLNEVQLARLSPQLLETPERTNLFLKNPEYKNYVKNSYDDANKKMNELKDDAVQCLKEKKIISGFNEGLVPFYDYTQMNNSFPKQEQFETAVYGCVDNVTKKAALITIENEIRTNDSLASAMNFDLKKIDEIVSKTLSGKYLNRCLVNGEQLRAPEHCSSIVEMDATKNAMNLILQDKANEMLSSDVKKFEITLSLNQCFDTKIDNKMQEIDSYDPKTKLFKDSSGQLVSEVKANDKDALECLKEGIVVLAQNVTDEKLFESEVLKENGISLTGENKKILTESKNLIAECFNKKMADLDTIEKVSSQSEKIADVCSLDVTKNVTSMVIGDILAKKLKPHLDLSPSEFSAKITELKNSFVAGLKPLKSQKEIDNYIKKFTEETTSQIAGELIDGKLLAIKGIVKKIDSVNGDSIHLAITKDVKDQFNNCLNSQVDKQTDSTAYCEAQVMNNVIPIIIQRIKAPIKVKLKEQVKIKIKKLSYLNPKPTDLIINETMDLAVEVAADLAMTLKIDLDKFSNTTPTQDDSKLDSTFNTIMEQVYDYATFALAYAHTMGKPDLAKLALLKLKDELAVLKSRITSDMSAIQINDEIKKILLNSDLVSLAIKGKAQNSTADVLAETFSTMRLENLKYFQEKHEKKLAELTTMAKRQTGHSLRGTLKSIENEKKDFEQKKLDLYDVLKNQLANIPAMIKPQVLDNTFNRKIVDQAGKEQAKDLITLIKKEMVSPILEEYVVGRKPAGESKTMDEIISLTKNQLYMDISHDGFIDTILEASAKPTIMATIMDSNTYWAAYKSGLISDKDLTWATFQKQPEITSARIKLKNLLMAESQGQNLTMDEKMKRMDEVTVEITAAIKNQLKKTYAEAYEKKKKAIKDWVPGI